MLYVSPQVEELLGYSPQEWLAIPDLWSRILHPEDRKRVLAEDARTERTGEKFSSEHRLLGARRHYSVDSRRGGAGR